MHPPKVTAIIPAYNAATYLPKAIESVFAQTYRDWEIVLIDDGSTDNTGAVAQPYRLRAPERLRYFYQENQGLPAARNAAIRHARGELIAILDADDVWKPERLVYSVAALDGRPDVGLAHGRVERIDSEGHFIDFPPANRRWLEGNISHYIYTRRAHIQCPTATFRRSCVEVLGGFDSAIPGTADRDFWFRISEHYRVAFVDKLLASYRVTSDSMSHDVERMRTWQIRFVQKHYGSKSYRPGDLRLAMASIHREQGDLLFRSDWPKALGQYLRALAYNP